MHSNRDQQEVESLIAGMFQVTIVQQFGDKGVRSLDAILRCLNTLYRYLDAATYEGRIRVFCGVEEGRGLAEINNRLTPVVDFKDIGRAYPNGLFIRVSGSDFAAGVDWDDDVSSLCQCGILYEFESGSERFSAKDVVVPVEKPGVDRDSWFCVKTFTTLSEALTEYERRMVRQSSCKIFQEAWFDDARIVFKNKPEAKMRDSLTQFLKSHLRGDFEVRPEQIVDETHPVDIKVTWFGTNRLALIEIKWLGDSVSPDGNRVSTSYRDCRARDGAAQLAGYLERNKQQVPMHQTRGYLVIIDGRRENARNFHGGLSAVGVEKYRNAHILFDPDFAALRPDFAEPVRMFAEAARLC